MNKLPPPILLEAIRERKSTLAAERSLIEFTKQAFKIIEPGSTFVDNWHLRAIADHLEAMTNNEFSNLVINIPPGCMKLCADSTIVPTPSGYLRHGDLAPGDFVFGPDGLPTEILAISEKAPANYRVSFSNGEAVECNGEHLWTVYDKYNLRREVTLSVNELIARGSISYMEKGGKLRYRFALPDRSPLQHLRKNLILDPYFFGCWLGDGRSSGTDITHDIEDHQHIDKIVSRGMFVSKVWMGAGRTAHTSFAKQGVRQALRGMGVLNNKRIAEGYLLASLGQRLELLAGIIDTDGSVDQKRGRVSIVSCSDNLAQDIVRLVNSVGARPHTIRRKVPDYGGYSSGKTATTIMFNPIVTIPTAIPRKYVTKIDAMRRRVAITEITPVENPEMGNCISVARADGLYLVGENHVVTHNSILVSVMWPAWEWIRKPEHRYLGASYGSELAIRDAMKCRDIIMSEWYQQRWPHIMVRKGDDQKLKYALVSGGWRMATSTGGRGTGEHPDTKIIDDPTSSAQADSEAERETANLWFDRTLSTRGESRGAKTVVVMQRLHDRDLTGHIFSEQKGYEHLCLPMEYEASRKRTVTKIGWEDPRTVEGSLLWPELFPRASVERLKRLLGEYGTAGQLQQRPNVEGGGILKVTHFQLWPDKKPLPAFEYVVQSYDCAFTEKTTGDPTACTVWGTFTDKGKRGAMLLDAWSEHLSYPDMREKVIQEWGSVYGKTDEHKGRRADVILVEAKASGQSLLQDLRQSNIPAIPYNPGMADKINRAHQMAPILELDCLWIPESRKNPGDFVTWAKPIIRQLERFPNAEHDDFCDATSQAMILLRDQGRFELSFAGEDLDDEPKEVDYYKKSHRINPYAA